MGHDNDNEISNPQHEEDSKADNYKYEYIYKILPEKPPSPLPLVLQRSALDSQDGYIHLSTHAQVGQTAGRFFSQHQKLWILKIRLDSFEPFNFPSAIHTNTGEGSETEPSAEKKQSGGNSGNHGHGHITWETAGSHGTFPHLYDGELGVDVVEQVLEFDRRLRARREDVGVVVVERENGDEDDNDKEERKKQQLRNWEDVLNELDP